MAVRTGTASQVNGSAASGSTSVTVPADATGVLAFACWWELGPGTSDLTTLTLGGISLTDQFSVASGAALNGFYIGTLFSLPGVGSQTLAWAYTGGTGNRDEGGEIILVWLKALVPATPIRDVDGISGSAGTNLSLTLDTGASDLLIQFCESLSPNGPPVGDGTPFIDDAVINSHIYDVSQVTPSGGSTTILGMTGEADSTMMAASFPSSGVSAQVPMIHHPVFSGAVG